MPLLRYFVGVGSALLCLMFLFDAYLPKAPPREQHDIDHSTIRIAAPSSSDFVINQFPSTQKTFQIDPAEAVRQAMALMPPDEGGKKAGQATRPDRTREASVASPSKKKRIAHRAHPTPNDVASGQPGQNWANNGGCNGWGGSSWSNNSWGNWNSSWSRGWASNQWTR